MVQWEAAELDQLQQKQITLSGLFGVLLMVLEVWSSLTGGYEIQKIVTPSKYGPNWTSCSKNMTIICAMQSLEAIKKNNKKVMFISLELRTGPIGQKFGMRQYFWISQPHLRRHQTCKTIRSTQPRFYCFGPILLLSTVAQNSR